jgi:hypothetical protein
VTKAKVVSHLGQHTVYKIEDTEMLYIPSPTCGGAQMRPEEQKYLKLFQVSIFKMKLVTFRKKLKKMSKFNWQSNEKA